LNNIALNYLSKGSVRVFISSLSTLITWVGLFAREIHSPATMVHVSYLVIRLSMLCEKRKDRVDLRNFSVLASNAMPSFCKPIIIQTIFWFWLFLGIILADFVI